MKRLIVVLLIVLCSLLSAVSIREIRAFGEPIAACRLALEMDKNASFQVEKRVGGYYVGIDGFDGSLPSYDLSDSFFDAIAADSGGIFVFTNENLSYEKLALTDSNTLVVDFYKQVKSKEERLALARFHSNRGRFARADKICHELWIDYRNHYDILLVWGEVLIKRGSKRATEKLEMIPSGSPYHSRAQELLASLDADAQPAIVNADQQIDIPQDADDTEAIEPQESLQKADIQDKIHEQTPLWTKRNIAIAAVVVIALLIAFIIILLIKLKSAQGSKNYGIQERTTEIDTATITKMVNRLLADGWTNKEIARELKISRFEVEQAIKRLHFLGGLDDSSET